MGRRIDPSCGEPIDLFLVPASAPRLVVTKAMVCAILSRMVHIKEPLLLIVKSSVCGGIRFPFSLIATNITINKMC